MKHFIMDWTGHDREGQFHQITSQVRDVHGQELESVDYPLKIFEIRKGLDVRQAGDAYLMVSFKKRIGDLLRYNVRGSCIISVEAMAVFANAGITIDEEIYRWPLHVLTTVRERWRDYIVLWAMRRWDILDYNKAQVKRYETGCVREVVAWALDAAKLPSYDIFRTDYHRYIVSERVVEAVRDAHLTGFEFKEVV